MKHVKQNELIFTSMELVLYNEIVIKIDQKKLEEVCRKYQVDFLGVFGSVARGDDRPDSDVDLLVRFSKEKKITLIDLEDVEESFERAFGRSVDLVTTKSVSPYMKRGIMNDLKSVYGTI